MFIVIWRHNTKCPWTIWPRLYGNRSDAEAACRNAARYDVAPRDYFVTGIDDNWKEII